MKIILVWLHTQHEDTIKWFIALMDREGWEFVSRSSVGVTGTCFVKFAR